MSSPAPDPARRRGGRRGGTADTRGDILRAAREQFAAGYEATSVRAVARGAGVDPSLIVQFFGGKDGLFKAVLDDAIRPDEGIKPALAGGTGEIGPRLAAYFFGIWEDPVRRPPFQAMLVSAASNAAAAEVLREFVRDEVIGRLSLAIGGGAGQRTARRTRRVAPHRRRPGAVRLPDTAAVRRPARGRRRAGRARDPGVPDGHRARVACRCRPTRWSPTRSRRGGRRGRRSTRSRRRTAACAGARSACPPRP